VTMQLTDATLVLARKPPGIILMSLVRRRRACIHVRPRARDTRSDMAQDQNQPNREYDVALSFAGEDRAYVEAVALSLRQAGVSVFYDRYEEAALWGKNLYDHLRHVYAEAAEYTVMFVSEAYARKLWTSHERESAQSRAFEERREYILPARFDETDVPGLLRTTGYVDLRQKTPEELASLILKKLRPSDSPEPDPIVLPMTSIYAIDEEALESAIQRFGQDWPRPTIVWPSYCDRLIALIRDTIRKFDDEATNLAGSDFFIKNAPRAIAFTRSNRDEIQSRTSSMVRRLSGMREENIKNAIRTYLLLANTKIHYTLAHLSTWDGLEKLGRGELKSLIPFLGTTNYLTKLFDSNEATNIGRLHYINDFPIFENGTNYTYLNAPKSILEGSSISINYESAICSWFIPQIELKFLDGHDLELPTRYLGEWKFGVVRGDNGKEIPRRGSLETLRI
jgi:hypothetical protein